MDQDLDILLAVTERCELILENIESKIEVFPKRAGPDCLFQIPIGGGDDTRVYRDLLVAPDLLEDSVLQETEKFCLASQ